MPAPARHEFGIVVRLPLDFPDKVDRLCKLREREDELLDEILIDVLGPRERRSGRADNRSRKPRASVPDLRVGDAGPEWLASLVTKARADGSLVVTIGAQRFVLQPYLGALLLALAEDNGLSTDEGVGFKSIGDLATRIAKRTGGLPPSHATLNKYIHRLRKILVRRAGLTSEAIQTHRTLGRRLAVLRRATPWSRPTGGGAGAATFAGPDRDDRDV